MEQISSLIAKEAPSLSRPFFSSFLIFLQPFLTKQLNTVSFFTNNKNPKTTNLVLLLLFNFGPFCLARLQKKSSENENN